MQWGEQHAAVGALPLPGVADFIENSHKVPLLLQGWDSPQLILAVWKLNVFFMDVIWAVERI